MFYVSINKKNVYTNENCLIMNRLIYFFVDVVSKICRRLYLGAPLFGVAKLFCRKRVVVNAENAFNVLNSYWQDCGSSCVTDNKINDSNFEYDLHVIIPVYNVEKYVKQCVDSVINQKTKYSFCVTLVNDGSTDNSRAILNEYEQDARIEIINQENQGQAVARNVALQNVKGRYITFVDSDDYMMPDAIENLMDKAISANADIVQGGYITFGEGGEVYETANYEDVNSNALVAGFPWGKVYKSSLFGNICFPSGNRYEDTVLHMVVLPIAKQKASVSSVVYAYRINLQGVSKMSHHTSKTIDSIYVTEILLKDRVTLELPFEQTDYENFLYQVVKNFHRIASFKNEEVMRASFDVHVKLKSTYFASYVTRLPRNERIELALSRQNYTLYRIACSL